MELILLSYSQNKTANTNYWNKKGAVKTQIFANYLENFCHTILTNKLFN